MLASARILGAIAMTVKTTKRKGEVLKLSVQRELRSYYQKIGSG